MNRVLGQRLTVPEEHAQLPEMQMLFELNSRRVKPQDQELKPDELAKLKAAILPRVVIAPWRRSPAECVFEARNPCLELRKTTPTVFWGGFLF